MHRQPAAIDGEIHAAAIFRRTAAIAKQKRLVDFLDVDAALNWLDRIGDLEDPARVFFWIGIGAVGGVLGGANEPQPLIFLVAAFDLIETPSRIDLFRSIAFAICSRVFPDPASSDRRRSSL